VKRVNHKKLASKIIRTLKREGAVIHRYDAHSSNSIYIKIDAGICGSIRISDHKGKKHLAYRYNLLTNIKEFDVIKEPYVRYFYPADDIDIMIGNIIAYRQEKIAEHHGELFYPHAIHSEMRKRRKQPGFWQRAVIV
jgi:hypothetical protein